jgi:hypothetical protein
VIPIALHIAPMEQPARSMRSDGGRIWQASDNIDACVPHTAEFCAVGCLHDLTLSISNSSKPIEPHTVFLSARAHS